MRECLGPSSPSQFPSDVDWERGELGSGRGGGGVSFTTQPVDGERTKFHGQGDEEDRCWGVGAGHEQGGDGGYGGWRSGGRGEWGHRGMVCSQCCVERGADGEVRCLGCLRAEEGG